MEINHGPPPGLPEVLVHRDYHPGNVLWRRSKISGVVDWQAACTGPAVADVAHCRVNLLTFGTAFHPGPTWPPSSASSTTCATTGDPKRSSWRDMLAHAVAELGGTSR